MRLTNIDPDLRSFTSSSFEPSLSFGPIGLLTFKTISAFSSTLSASSRIFAPASSYSWSVIAAVMPAPFSMFTLSPIAINFLTVSGVAATRFSSNRLSLIIPICIECAPIKHLYKLKSFPRKPINREFFLGNPLFFKISWSLLGFSEP